MALRGRAVGLGLEEVVHFLASNQLEGTLEVRRGEEASLRVYFRPDGGLFFPWSARRGTYSLGKILRHTGFLSRESLEKYLDAVRRRRKAELLQAEADQAALEDARRRQSSEELQDLFLWRDVRFEFRPEPLPPRVEQDLEAGRGLSLDPQALLFEVARRADERRRIRQAIPSSRAILRARAGADERVLAALRAIGVDLDRSPFNGEQSLDELLEAWGIPHHAALTSVAELVEQGDAHLLPPESARARVRERLEAGDLGGAARALGHLVELERSPDQPPPTEPLELAFAAAPAFRAGPATTCRMRLGGARAFALLQSLLAGDAAFTLELHDAGRALRVGGQAGELLVSGDLSGEASAPADERALLKRVAGELCRAGWWTDADVELSNHSAQRPLPARVTGEPPRQLALPLTDPAARERLGAALERWARVLRDMPSEALLLVPGERCDAGDPAARFFTRFDLAHTVGEVRQQARVDLLEFAAFVSRGLDRRYLRRPTSDELQAALVAARAAGNEPQVERLLRALPGAGATGGPRAPDPEPEPVLEGDLDGVGLAAILQALRDQRRTGTLVVRAAGREERLLLHRGDAFLLRLSDDAEAAEFANFLLGDEGSDELEALAELAPAAAPGGEPSAAERREMLDGLLDLLFQEGATFAFQQGLLPDELFAPPPGADKVALDTRAFLLEAIGALTEWDRHRQSIPSRAAVLRFPAGEKAAVLQACPGNEQLLLLIDGRRSFQELVAAAGCGVLEAARVLVPLVDAGKLERLGDEPPPPVDGPPVADADDVGEAFDALLG